MASPDPAIKQEPLDDDYEPMFNTPTFASPLFIPENDEPAFVDPDTVLQRATDKDGRPFPTRCFQQPHLQHPHHHRLICGHDIVTDTIQKCGGNCAISEDKKAAGMGFACPHLDCKKVAGHFMPKRDGPKPRKCTLSHVYGRDLNADEQRLEEKRTLEEARKNRITTRSGQVLLPQALRVPKRSPSPSAASKAGTGSRTTKDKKTFDTDIGESLNKEFENDPAHDSVMQMTGGRARANGAFKTDKQKAEAGQMIVLTRGMSVSQIATSEEQSLRKKKALKRTAKSKPSMSETGPDLRDADIEPQLKLQIECSNCFRVITGLHHRCSDCQEDFDLCWECFENKSHGHTVTHRFAAIAQPYDGWQEGSTMLQQKFCICGTTSTSFLVLCNDCQYPFHPGCIGAGAWEKAEYSLEHWSRGRCMKQDHLSWKGGKVFRCEGCQKLFEEANAHAQKSRDLRVEERLKKQTEAAEKQQEDEGEDEQEGYGAVVFPGPKPGKRMAEELDDEPKSHVEDGALHEAKRFKFDLAFRPKM
ncbi:hypothetical protein PRZ48_003703 [Zasmidium cellare]|uniref:ZZ-type domain-containing protein n=1 Tax=Zasmidium cellare TaxID=395010 RepID=A0ABR0EXD7_ZASCE|nr:hypothetical protein PRZ48_003703 [Zasmidium cellare]